MTNSIKEIGAKVRGVAGEKRYSQQRVADILKLSRQAVSERYNGKVGFAAHELFTLAQEWDVPVSRFFPSTQILVERVA